MTLHATERIENVRARLNEHALSLALTGAPTIICDGERRTAPGGRVPFVRLTVEPTSERNMGCFSTTQSAEDARALAVYDLFWPDGSADDVRDAYEIDRVASEIVSALRHNSLDFRDYTAQDGSYTAVTAPIRFIDNPERRRLPDVDGFARRQVAAECRWIAQVTHPA